MKLKFLHKKMFLLALILTIAASSIAQTQITVTSSKENSYCNATCTVIDNPELNGNPDAIIIVTPILVSGIHGTPKGGYPHPIAVYYINQKWSILHLDNTPIQPGTQFNVQYYLQPGPDQFVYVIPANGSNDIYNANPNVPKVKVSAILITQSLAPTLRSGSVQNNANVEIKEVTEPGRVQYTITNVLTGIAPTVGSAYNIVLSSSSNATSGTNSNPTGNAGGDLSGSYPSPTVVKLLGRPLSERTPNIGQVLKWNGSTWAPANDSTCCPGTITPSDIRFKKNILPLQNGLQKILALNGITYYWRADEFTDKGFDNSQQIGFIAQEVEKIFPQLVVTGTDGYKGVDYTKLIPVMVEAIKEQQKQIDELKKIVARLTKL